VPDGLARAREDEAHKLIANGIDPSQARVVYDLFMHPRRIYTPRLYPPGYTRSIDNRFKEGFDGHPFYHPHPGPGHRDAGSDRISRTHRKEMIMDIVVLAVAAALFVYLLAALCKPEWFQ